MSTNFLMVKEVVHLMTQERADIRTFLATCASGDSAAQRSFQEEYGGDIYNFPVKIYGVPLEEAGDFYVYVFDRDRIFSRLKTFEGRNSIQFKTFLSYYVLRHLFFEWQRSQKEIHTVSIQTPVDSSGEETRTLEDILPAQTATDVDTEESQQTLAAKGILRALSPEEQLDLKLLSLLEYDLSPRDIRLLAKAAGRSIGETVALVAEVQEGLKRKDQKIARLRDELDSVWGWIQLRQKNLQQTDKKMRLLSETMPTAERIAIAAEKAELEQALAKRYRQRERILQELRMYKLTTPYKDIARLLNLTVGTVCSRIFRLRERIVREFGESETLEEHV